MKLTLDIPTERTAEVLRFLAALMPASDEPQADPAPGHPEFPVVRLAVDPSAADPFKVAMDNSQI